MIQSGDIVLGYDLTTFVGDGDWDANLNSQFVVPDCVLVKKVTDKKNNEADVLDNSNKLEQQPKLSKKKQRRRRRKENRKMKELEERVERMGFYDDSEDDDGEEGAGDGDFETALQQDPEMEKELEALEAALEDVNV